MKRFFSPEFLQWLQRIYQNAWRRWQLPPRYGRPRAFEASYLLPEKFRLEVTKMYEYRTAQEFTHSSRVNSIRLDAQGHVFVQKTIIAVVCTRGTFQHQWFIHQLGGNVPDFESLEAAKIHLTNLARRSAVPFWRGVCRIIYQRLTGEELSPYWPFR